MSIIKRIEELRTHTSNTINEVQKATIPYLYDLDWELQQTYFFDGIEHRYNVGRLVILVKNLPFLHNLKRIRFTDSLSNVVNNLEIQPFLLFADGKFIKWSDITVVYDYNWKYLVIDNYAGSPYAKINFVLLPLCIKYNEGSTSIGSNCIFAFDNDGKCINTTSTTATTITMNNTNIYYETSYLTPGSKQAALIDSKYKVSELSPILFKDGILYTTGNVIHYGLNIFSVDDGNYTANQIFYKLFYYIYGNTSKDNILNVDNQDYIFDTVLSSNNIPRYIEELSVPFNFDFDKNKSYADNIANSLKYIMEYNPALMNEVYEETSNIQTLSYTGTYIKSKANAAGFVTMSRNVNGYIHSFVLIFINGELYKGYKYLKYSAGSFTFPLVDINDSDKIEILKFTNIDNRILSGYVSSDNDSDDYYIDPNININYLKLFSKDVKDKAFDIPDTDFLQYEVNFSASKSDTDKMHLILKDSYYYDRELTFASSRQFRYFYTISKGTSNKIQLSEEFRFCTERNKYVVFINGRKLDSSNFEVTLVKNTRPINDISIYFAIQINIGDRIDIFYLPENLEETLIEPSIPISSGVICIDKTKLSYNMSKELYLVFVNGKKISKDNITDIDSTRMKIITDIKSIKNICILKHISDNDVLSSIYKDSQNLMDKALSETDGYDLNKLYPSETLTDTEIDIKQNTIDMQEVLNQILKDYWIRTTTYSKTNDVLLYDYDSLSLETKDNDGNIIIEPPEYN